MNSISVQEVGYSVKDWASTGCHLFLPLQSQEGILGVLELQSAREQDFEVEDFLSLQELADVVAIKLEIIRRVS